MGGPGSGNQFHWWRRTKKTVVESCLILDANRFMREGILRADVHESGNWRWTYSSGRTCSILYEVRTSEVERPWLRLAYTNSRDTSGEVKSIDYIIRLATTQPNLGGLRWWFHCPLVSDGRPCRRRVGKLYLPPRGNYFGCRHCHQLTYKSCQESRKFDRLYRTLAATLGTSPKEVKQLLKTPWWRSR